MSIESLNDTVQRLLPSVEALAALGAHMQLRRNGATPHPRMQEQLREVVRAMDPALFEDIVVDQQEAIVLATVQWVLRYAADLLDDPARAPGWQASDPVMVQAFGQQSRRVVGTIEAYAALRPDLKRTLEQPGAFLDVGCGAGWLSIEAAQSWPALRTVGIDPWEPALDLARANIATAGLDGRIELRVQAIQDLSDREAFTLVWLPGPFLSPVVMPVALERAVGALRPGGWVVFGTFRTPSDPLGQALTGLRVLRTGGHLWEARDIEERLRTLGFEQVASASPGARPTLLVAGRKRGSAPA
jgi:SAM-dependent methyltransferase